MVDKSKLGRPSGRGEGKSNGCGSDGCNSYSVNTVKHVPSANGKTAHSKDAKTSAKVPKMEKFALDDGGVKLEDWQRLASESFDTLKRENSTPEQIEMVRTAIVGIINEAFGYSAADASLTPSVDDDDDDSSRDADLDEAILEQLSGDGQL